MKPKILGVMFIILLLFSIGCTGSEGTTTAPTTTPLITTPTTTTTTPPITTSTTTTTTQPTTTRGPLEPPSVEELIAGYFANPEIPRITAEKLKQLKDAGEPVLLVNVQPAWAFNMVRLPKAINVPAESWTQPTEAEIAPLLRLSSDRLIVLYCD